MCVAVHPGGRLVASGQTAQPMKSSGQSLSSQFPLAGQSERQPASTNQRADVIVWDVETKKALSEMRVSDCGKFSP